MATLTEVKTAFDAYFGGLAAEIARRHAADATDNLRAVGNATIVLGAGAPGGIITPSDTNPQMHGFITFPVHIEKAIVASYPTAADCTVVVKVLYPIRLNEVQQEFFGPTGRGTSGRDVFPPESIWPAGTRWFFYVTDNTGGAETISVTFQARCI